MLANCENVRIVFSEMCRQNITTYDGKSVGFLKDKQEINTLTVFLSFLLMARHRDFLILPTDK